MHLIVLILTLTFLFILLLYCCIHINTPGDRDLDDVQQEYFLRHFRKRKKK